MLKFGIVHNDVLVSFRQGSEVTFGSDHWFNVHKEFLKDIDHCVGVVQLEAVGAEILGENYCYGFFFCCK